MITTRVLDTTTGDGAVGVTVILEMRQATEWAPIGRGNTGEDGRLDSLTDNVTIAPGAYRLTFDIGAYHRGRGIAVPFFPEVRVAFNVRDPEERYHVPLLLSPFGYTTFKGV